MWYDDPISLIPKYEYAKQKGLRGVGPFRFDQLDPVKAYSEFKEMMDALKVFLD